ncbi:hypothetical protein P4S73_06235 [Paraglaciecola sp. Hal342]
MTLISLLLVLFVERVTTKSRYWQADFYSAKYLAGWQRRDGLAGKPLYSYCCLSSRFLRLLYFAY